MKEAVRYGWDTMKRHFWFFAGVLLVIFLINIIPDTLRAIVQKTQGAKLPLASLVPLTLFGLLFWALQVVAGMGFIKIALAVCDNRKRDFADLFSCFPLFFKYLGGMVLYGLIVVGGIILLIVPGIIWAVKFQYYGYCIIDKHMGPVAALKKSAAITRGTKGDLLLFNLLLVCINLLGILALLIGLFATIPATVIAQTRVYRILSAQAA